MTTAIYTGHTGMSRTRVQRNHALVTPESHVPVILPGWDNAEVVVLISAEMGAKFEQSLVHCQSGASLSPLRPGDELFALVLEGSVAVVVAGDERQLDKDDYCYLPPEQNWRITSSADARLMVFSKPYISLGPAGAIAPPEALFGSLGEVPAEPFLGDEGALLQVLFPDELAWDWGINVFEFVPGGTLPNVESHFMEHGLYLLGGEGVYRLGESWYPVAAGDCIWMGPYLPQWYAATGKSNSRYIYYKEMHRPPVG